MSSTKWMANLLLDERRTSLDIPMWMRSERDELHLQYTSIQFIPGSIVNTRVFDPPQLQL